MAMRRPRLKVKANLINPKRKEFGPKPLARPTALEDKSGQAGKGTEVKATVSGVGINALAEIRLEARNDARPRDELRDASYERPEVVGTAQLENLQDLEVGKSSISHLPTEKEQDAADGEIGVDKSEPSLEPLQLADPSLVATQATDASSIVTQRTETMNKPPDVIPCSAVSLDAPITDSSLLESSIAGNELKTQSELLSSFEKPASASVFQQKKTKTEPKLHVTKPAEARNDCIQDAAHFPINSTTDQKATTDASLHRFEVLEDRTNIQPSLRDSPKRFNFKYPPTVADEHEVSESAIEDDIIKTDLQKSAHSLPNSTTKSRQRIKATPIFGQRRKRTQSTVTEEEATTTTDSTPPKHPSERHNSGPQYHPYTNTVASPQYNSPHKAIPHSMGRKRTESREIDHSQRHSRREYKARFGQGVPEKSKLKMFDLLYYNPKTNPVMEHADDAALLKKNRREKEEFLRSMARRDIKNLPSSPDISDDRNSELPVPQLKLNANGEIILDESTLQVEREAEQRARVALANSKLIHFDADTGMNGFYKRLSRPKQWSSDETVKFYRALQRLGPAFSLMEQLFPNRTERDLKLKFKKEERCNLNLINKAISTPRAFDLDELKKQLEEEDRARAEAKEKRMEIERTKRKPRKKVRAKSAAARALCHGDEVCGMENVASINISKCAIKRVKEIKAEKESVKPKRKYNKRKQAEPSDNADTMQASLPVKKKIKTKPEPATDNNPDLEHVILLDDKLEYEISELLDIAAVEIEDSEEEGLEEKGIETKVLDTKDCAEVDNWAAESDQENVTSVGSPGTVDEHADECEVDHSNLECVEEMNEQRKEHLQKLFEDLCSGCLAVVTSEDPDEPGQLRNDIYMLNKASGQLCDRPLDLPDDTRDSILALWEECS